VLNKQTITEKRYQGQNEFDVFSQASQFTFNSHTALHVIMMMMHGADSLDDVKKARSSE
jgi:hypothetical protein